MEGSAQPRAASVAFVRAAGLAWLAWLGAANHLVVRAVEPACGTLARVVPRGPHMSLPSWAPKTQDVVDQTFVVGLATLEAQRSFTAELLAAASPLMRRITGHDPVPAKP